MKENVYIPFVVSTSFMPENQILHSADESSSATKIVKWMVACMCSFAKISER